MSSKPVVYDKSRWDTATGLDYSDPRQFFPKPYKHHDFEPLFKKTKLIAQYDMEGRGDGFQINKRGDYLYMNHFWSSGYSVVNVKDPRNPKVVYFESTDCPHVWTLKNRVHGDILVTTLHAEDCVFWGCNPRPRCPPGAQPPRPPWYRARGRHRPVWDTQVGYCVAKAPVAR